MLNNPLRAVDPSGLQETEVQQAQELTRPSPRRIQFATVLQNNDITQPVQDTTPVLLADDANALLNQVADMIDTNVAKTMSVVQGLEDNPIVVDETQTQTGEKIELSVGFNAQVKPGQGPEVSGGVSGDASAFASNTKTRTVTSNSTAGAMASLQTANRDVRIAAV